MAKAVIMAGGQGERFWPLTHKGFPKYRIRFEAKKSLLQRTYSRLLKVYGRGNVYVVTVAAHARMIREELPALPARNLIQEPFRNNTCAAIFLSCAKLARAFGKDEIVSFFPADHLIKDEKAFARTMKNAISTARRSDALVTIGVKPTYAATGFGYIRKGRRLRGASDVFAVERFVEKPNRARANRYLRDGRFYWNAGIFTWKLGAFFAEMKSHCPDFGGRLDMNKLQATYKTMPSISIDYALMEKTDRAAVCAARMDWCDMGSWEMLYEKSLGRGEKVYAEGACHFRETSDSLILNSTRSPLVLLGLSGVMVVQTPFGTLVCRRGRSEEAALIAKKL